MNMKLPEHLIPCLRVVVNLGLVEVRIAVCVKTNYDDEFTYLGLMIGVLKNYRLHMSLYSVIHHAHRIRYGRPRFEFQLSRR